MSARQLLLLSLAMSSQLYAQDVQIVGTLDENLTVQQSQSITQKTHPIKLLKIKLSDKAIDTLNKRTQHALRHKGATISVKSLPNQIQLGMNNVPVLDQGRHGSCVTFANTAALDAVLKQGDHISQLCSLQLGNYLEENGYGTSGWDGSWGRTVLSQIESFGIVNKHRQRTAGCGGLTDYPTDDETTPDSEINLEDFHSLSENINNQISWSPILDAYTAITDRVDTDRTINEIKKALKEQDRVTFGVLLLDFDLGVVGAVGSYHGNYDTWVLTPEIARDIYLNPMFGGHEMIITGYDDNAIATDEQGRQHKGLFTLRNSWGDSVGDKGNFYMSYDYFKVLVIEAQRIRSMPADGGLASATA